VSLEVGAGVGAATSELLPALGSRVGAYAYSDVSDVFLDRGRERFGHVPALRASACSTSTPRSILRMRARSTSSSPRMPSTPAPICLPRCAS
jgi:hypothetical protein